MITAQRNWIGRSEGAHVTFDVVDGEPMTVYTTRPDTLFGATFMVVAADAKLAGELVTDDQRPAYDAYLEEVRKASDIERLSTDREKSGVFLGRYAVNPVNGAADPDLGRRLRAGRLRHRRDHGRARAGPARLGLRQEVRPADHPHRPAARRLRGRRRRTSGRARPSTPPTTRSPWTGWPIAEAKSAIIAWLEQQGTGTRRRELPAARLAAVAPALLGRADPDRALPRPAARCRCPRTSCPSCCPSCAAPT